MADSGADADTQTRGVKVHIGSTGMHESSALRLGYQGSPISATGRKNRTMDYGLDCWLEMIDVGALRCLVAIIDSINYHVTKVSAGSGASNPLPSNEVTLYVLGSITIWRAILA